MKKTLKISFFILLLITLSGCLNVENTRFEEDFSAYKYAMEKYQSSRGISYKRIINERIYNETTQTYETSQYVYNTTVELDKNFKVVKLHSKGEVTSNTIGNKEYGHYYLANNYFDYIRNKDSGVEEKPYDLSGSRFGDYANFAEETFKIENMIPIFSEDQVSQFEIVAIGTSYSITFLAAAPDYCGVSETIKYKYVISYDGVIEEMQYEVIVGENTYQYYLEVQKFNLFVKMPEFPTEISQYFG